MKVFKARKAFQMQKWLARRVEWKGDIDNIRKVVGLDLSYVKGLGVGVAVLLNYPELKPLRYSVAVDEVPIPYVPGLLAFREAPLMFSSYQLLGAEADLIFVDGHGVTHPRGLGIASHIGLVLGKPSIGAAKKKLVGEIARDRDGREYLIINGRKAAVVIRPKPGRTVYLSIGHKISIDSVVKLAPTFFKGHPLPEPTYVADRISKEVKRKLAEGVER
jgi:deoxyribonuclease V